jgi:hypothetical protein
MAKKASKRRACVVNRRYTHAKVSRKEQEACGKDRQNAKANGRGDAAKGIQHGFVARLTRLNSFDGVVL